MNRVVLVTGVVTIALLANGCTSTAQNEPVTVDQQTSTGSSEQATPTQPAKTEFKVAEVVKLGEREFVVNSSKRTKEINAYTTANRGKELVIVNVTIRNQGSQEISFNSFDFKMQDANGVQTSAHASSYSLPDALNSGSLASGGKVTGSLVFEIPEGDAVKLIFQPSFWSNERITVDL